MTQAARRDRSRSKAGSPKKLLRVLHVINGLGPGGAETVLYRLVTHPSDVQHEVISLARPDWYSSLLEHAGIVVHHLNWSMPSAAVASLRLHRLIRQSQADVVQAWMYRSNLLAGLSAHVAGKPVVWNIRCSSLGPIRVPSRLVAYLGGALARWVPRFIINCSAQSTILHKRWGYGAAEGAVIPNGYDPEYFQIDERARAVTRSSLGLKPGTFVIGTIGRWHAQKGLPVFLEALRLLRERKIPARLLLTGRGLDLQNDELAQLISASGCADHVQQLGERRDIPIIARALDLHVLASIGAEGFPNVVAETMLSGTPNVVTDIGDSALIVGETGWVVPPRDAEKLANAIDEAFREWSSSPVQWAKRREAARSRIADNFSMDRMACAYEDVWKKVAVQGR